MHPGFLDTTVTGSRATAGRARLTVRANAGFRVLMLVLWLFSVLMTLVLSPYVDPPSQTLPVALAMTAVGVPPILMGTAAVRLRGERLEVTNPLLTSSVALDDVACLDHRHGFEVVLRSGSRIGFTGSAPSLIGTITRYWSARRMVDRIQAVVDRPLTVDTGWQPGDRPVIRRLRTTALLWCAGYVVGGSSAASAIAAALR